MVEFTKDYWQKKRDSSAKGSDVGKVLTEWQANCKAPSTFTSPAAFKLARTTADKLKKALLVAKQKAAKSQTTQALIKEYETEIGKYLHTLEDLYQDNCAEFLGVRQKLSQMAQRKSVQFENFINEAKAILERIEDFEKKAADANEPGRQMMWKASHELDEQLKKIAEEMNHLESQTGETMSTLKGKNPGHYHVEMDDVKEAEKFMKVATIRMNECSSYLKEMKQIQGEFKGAFDEVLSVISGQRKDRGAVLNQGIALRQQAAKLLLEIKDTIDRGIQVNMKDLRAFGQKPSVTANEKEVASVRLQDLTSRRQHIQLRVTQMAGFVKEYTRLERSFPNDQNVLATGRDITGQHDKALEGLQIYDGALEQGKNLAQAIANKPVAG